MSELQQLAQRASTVAALCEELYRPHCAEKERKLQDEMFKEIVELLQSPLLQAFPTVYLPLVQKVQEGLPPERLRRLVELVPATATYFN